ncbi:26S proteasome regulatory subunit 7-like isoform X1 [Magnolia sinica]|uniref:26S proteasome regulatory subunit 7-like isoform X1 n=1 Tax=Magnolia sinica TaxID=86752 RepID=UPI00265A90EA|nr:26S proteasome regulatory subunit 7-like isoform X1 [Magnolia sinica]
MMQEEQPLEVARCTKIINQNSKEAKYVINVKQIAKFVVGLGDKVSPTNIEEGMRARMLLVEIRKQHLLQMSPHLFGQRLREWCKNR